MSIEQRFMDEADRQIAAEAKASRNRLVRERAIKLQGEAQRIAAAAARPGLAEMQAELAALDARPDWSLSAAEDQRRDWLRSEIHDAKRRTPAAA